MMKKTVAVAALLLMVANSAFARDSCGGVDQQPCDPPTSMRTAPLDDGGMLALAAGCLAIGIRIAQRKRK